MSKNTAETAKVLTGANEAYVFNFEAEVARAKQDYPQETRNTTFLDMSKPGWRAKAIKWLRNTSPEYKTLLTTQDIPYALDKIALQMNGAFFLRDSVTRRSLLCSYSVPSLKLATIDENKEALMQFNHELGHIVVPGGALSVATAKKLATDPIKQDFAMNKVEITADCFAVLRGFTQATFSDADADSLALMRSVATIKDLDLIHLSTQSIDQIRIDAQDGKLTDLTPQEIKVIAREHAKKFSLSKAELSRSRAEELLAPAKAEELLKSVQALDVNSPLRYAVSRFLATEFKVSGKEGVSFAAGSAEFLENAHGILAAEIDALGMKRIISLTPAEKDLSAHSSVALTFATQQNRLNGKIAFAAYLKAMFD
jgi:hypothetical protein